MDTKQLVSILSESTTCTVEALRIISEEKDSISEKRFTLDMLDKLFILATAYAWGLERRQMIQAKDVVEVAKAIELVTVIAYRLGNTYGFETGESKQDDIPAVFREAFK